MKGLKKNFKRIIYLLLLIVLLFNTIGATAQKVFAAIAQGTYIARIYETAYTDNLGQNIFKIRVQGDEIPKLTDTGFGQTAFCLNHHKDHPEEFLTYNVSSDFSSGDFKKCARLAYLGYYRYSNSSGNASKGLTGREDNVQYAYTANLIWQNLGQVPNSYSLGSDFDSFKIEVMDEYNKWDTLPSFNGSNQTMNLGQTKEITDSNGVLQYYESFNFTKDKVTFKHTKGSNKMEITVANDATKENVTITQNEAESNKMGKYINTRSVQTNFVLSPIPANQATHQRLLVSYGYNDPKYLRINVNINLHGDLELAKKDNKGNFIPGVKFKVSYNEDMSSPIGTYTTLENGKVTVEDLNPKTVYIQEVEVPANLILDASIHEVTIKPNDVTPYTATNNWKQGRIKATKKDEETGKVVKKAGTVFDIYNSQDVKVSSMTTNNEGIATSELLDYGIYYIKEKTAPDKYTIKAEVSDNIDIKENGKTYEITATNIRVKGSVTISKEDTKTKKIAQGDATLKGAVYGVYTRSTILDPADGSKIYDANEKIGELVTDDEANATMNNLYLGEYYVQEITPSKGYNLDNTKYNFDLNYEGQEVKIVTKKVTVKERVISQPFEIIKVSVEGSTEAEILSGAEFTIKLKSDVEKYGSWEKAPRAKNADGETAAILVTDEKGYAKSERLPYGTYIVRETKVPDEKEKTEDFTVKITKDSSEPQTWRIFNDEEFTSVLAIIKKDAETNKTIQIAGAKFKIKNVDTNEYFGYWDWNPLPHYVDSWTTDKTGTVMTNDKLPIGNYQLEEQKSPKGYLISSEPVPFRISSHTAYEMLPDENTAVITVTQKDTSVKGQVNVEKKGEVLTKFEDGQFIYEEKGLVGAKYEIVARENILDPSGDGTVLYEKDKVADTITTNSEGKATSKKLPLGEYYVREVQAPENMVLSNEIKNVSLKYKDQNISIIFADTSFVNQRQKVDLNVIKKDADNDVELQGAEFGLYAKENIVNNNGDVIVDKGKLIETVTSNENGKVHFASDLPLVNYEIKELKAPIGYSSNDKVIEVDATYRGQDIETIKLEYEFKNEITKIEVSKQDITDESEIEGAHLTVFEKDNPGAIFDSWISGQDGKDEKGNIKPHLMKGLEVGKTYVLRETSSPYGFALTQDIEFTIEDTGKVQKVTMKDEIVYGELKFNKYGEIFNEVQEDETDFGKTKTPVWNESNLLGAEITIYAAEDIKIGNTTYYSKDEKVETLESDWDIVTSKKLPVGNYYYIETKVPHGYIANNEKHYFTVEDNQINELQVIESSLYNNRAKVNIDMKKTLEEQKIFENKEAYKDIIFGIYAREDIYDYMGNVAIENGTLIAISGITQEGHLENVPDLPNGVYYIKELATNSQYVLNDTEYDFEIGYKGKDIAEYTVTIGDKGVIDNKLARGTIQVRKVDTLDESKKLENIEFNISSKKDMSKIITTEKTNSEGIATFADLELGTYYIQEAKQVDGYTLNDTIYQVEVKENGDMLIINCENKPTEMTFSKVDETGTNELPGAKIQIIDKETGEIIEEWVSTKEPHIIHYLVEGKEYVMREVTAPNGYEIAEEITFIAGDGQKVTMKDMPTPVVQTGNETKYLLLIGSVIISLVGLTAGVIILKRRKEN